MTPEGSIAALGILIRWFCVAALGIIAAAHAVELAAPSDFIVQLARAALSRSNPIPPTWYFPASRILIWTWVGVGVAAIGVVIALKRARLVEASRFIAILLPSVVRISLMLLPVLLIVVLLGASNVVSAFDIGWAGFEKTGNALIFYHMARSAIALSVAAAMLGLGYWLLTYGFKPDLGVARLRQVLLRSFFLGGAVYAFAGTALALGSSLTRAASLLLLILGIALLPRLIGDLLKAKTENDRVEHTASWPWIAGSLSLWLAGGVGLLLFASKGLYPGVADGDVWVHYLHYLRIVVETGSSLPNEVWYHFFLSKGAGLFFLTAVISDPLAPQLVSSLFIGAAAVIVYDLLRMADTEQHWAALGVVLFMGAYVSTSSGEGAWGYFFKHHEVMAGLIAFIFWEMASTFRTDSIQHHPSRRVLLAVVLHLGFFQPVGAFLAITSLLLIIVLALWVRRRRDVAAIALQSITLLLIGVIGSLVLNFVITGLAELVPTQLMWAIADRAKFLSSTGFGVVAYFLQEHNALGGTVDAMLLGKLLRYDYFRLLLSPIMLFLIGIALTAGLLRMCAVVRTEPARMDPARALSYEIVAFFSPLVLFGLAVVNLSTFRLLGILTLPIAMLGALGLSFAAKTYVRSQRQSNITACLGLIFSISVSASILQNMGPERGASVQRFLSGRDSLLAVLSYTERNWGQDRFLEDLVSIRKKIGPNAKIFSFGHQADPSYAFPGRGLVSEPSYDLGPKLGEIVFGEPGHAKKLLQADGLDYFFISFRGDSAYLFNSLAFSRLFKGDNLARYFSLVYSNRDSYLLTWRHSASDSALPDRLTRLLELKQTAAMFLPFSNVMPSIGDIEGFILSQTKLLPAFCEGPVLNKQVSASINTTLKSIAVTLLQRRLGAVDLVHTDNIALASRIVDKFRERLDTYLTGDLATARASVAFGTPTCLIEIEQFSRQVAKQVMQEMSDIATQEIDVDFGPGFGRLLTNRNERWPLGEIYQNETNFSLRQDGASVIDRGGLSIRKWVRKFFLRD